jgi:hypothetical protein
VVKWIRALFDFVRGRHRARRIRRAQVGGATYIPCPLVSGLFRPSGDCHQCEYNLGEAVVRRRARQLCGFGVKARPTLPAPLRRVLDLFKRIRIPRPRVPARFQRRSSGTRPLSKIQRRHRERMLQREKQHAAQRRAREIRTKTAEQRMRRRRPRSPGR